MGQDYMDKTFLEIVTAHCDGEMSEVKQQMLAEMLRSNPELRRQFVMHLQIHAALKFGGPKFFEDEAAVIDRSLFPLSESSFCVGPEEESLLDFGNLDPLDGIAHSERKASPEKNTELRSPVFSFFTFLSQPVPLAVILFCVLVVPMAMMAWNINRNQPAALPAPPVVASQPPAYVVPGQVVNAVACTWDESQGIGLRVGDLLVSDREYHLKEGVLQLDFASGVQTIIQGPAIFRPKSSMKLELNQGRLAAKVPPEGRNFAVTMAGLEVIDRGTEFGVEVDRSAEVELHVFKGHIDVLADRWKQDNNKIQPLALYQGEASRVDRLTGQVKKMSADDTKFVRNFSNESGLNLNLVNPSFEEPRVADHPKRSKEFGNLHDVEIPGWKYTKSVDGTYWIYLQQAPYLTDPSGEIGKVQKCILEAFDGKQMMGVRLGGVNEAWAYQTLGTIKMGDIGKTLRVSTSVIARKPTSPDATAYGATATAVLAFTVDTTNDSPGEVLGLHGMALGIQMDQPKQDMTAELTIKPHMIGKKLMVRLLIRDPSVRAGGKLPDDYDPVNQYYFDVVDLKLQ